MHFQTELTDMFNLWLPHGLNPWPTNSPWREVATSADDKTGDIVHFDMEDPNTLSRKQYVAEIVQSWATNHPPTFLAFFCKK